MAEIERLGVSGSLENKTVIVTGASSGIGAEVGRTFARSGANVVLAARRKNRLEEVAEQIRVAGGKAEIVVGDVTDYAQVTKLVETAIDRFGGVDVMVNNAGYAVAKSLVDSTIEEIDGQIDVNFKAVCYGTKAVLPTMLEKKSGVIINIGSNCSFRHYPDYAAYVGAKFAVLGFSRSVYEEVREQGIRVNCLCPAAVNTEWADVAGAKLPWEKQVRLQPEDLADLALLCAVAPPRFQLDNILVWPTCESTT